MHADNLWLTECPSAGWLPPSLPSSSPARDTNYLFFKGKHLEQYWHGICSLQEGEPPAPIWSKGRKRCESGAQADTGESKAEEEDHGTDEMGTL
jgi:hypothetical protein